MATVRPEHRGSDRGKRIDSGNRNNRASGPPDRKSSGTQAKTRKKRKNNRKLLLKRLLWLALGTGVSVFLLITMILAFQPLSKAYAIELAKDSFLMHIGDEADIEPAFTKTTDRNYLSLLIRGKQKKITFESSDEKVAVVDEHGRITAKGKGTAQIYVRVSDLEKTVSIDSFVRGSSLTFVKNEYELNTGESFAAGTVLKPDDAVLFDRISYSVSDDSVIRVDENGTVTSVGPGLAYVRAMADGLTAEAPVRSYQPMSGIAFKDIEDGETVHMERGESRAFPVMFVPNNTTDARLLKYTLSDPDVGTVDENGVFRSKGRGHVTLTVQCNTFTETVTIMQHVSLRDIELAQTNASLNYQTQERLAFSPVPADTTDDLKAVYISSDTGVVTVDEDGIVTAAGPGTASVSVKVNGFEKKCVYTVLVPVTAVNISLRDMIMIKGDSTQLAAAVYPSFTTEDKSIVWTSDDSAIVSVDANGVIRANGAGYTHVNAVHGNVSTYCRVRVYDNASSPQKAASVIDYGKQFLGTRYVFGGDSLKDGIDCSSFTMQCMYKAGVYLPRTSIEQVEYGRSVPLNVSRWNPGDLVFYAPEGEISHVAIYIGDGQILHAAQSQGKVTITAYNYNGLRPVAVRRYF